MNFKVSADRWSVKACVQHLALTEKDLWKWAEATLKKPANGENRKEIKMTDQEIINLSTDRSQKFNAQESAMPEQSKWNTSEEAMNAFKEERMMLIKYVKTTTEDVRNHVTKSLFGSIDAYQVMLVISSHTARHTKQIEEVKANAAFPK